MIDSCRTVHCHGNDYSVFTLYGLKVGLGTVTDVHAFPGVAREAPETRAVARRPGTCWHGNQGSGQLD